MQKTVTDFRSTHLIYALQRQEDGSYVALNRLYKPVGFTSTERVKYKDFPVCFKFKRALSAGQIAALSFDGNPAPECIYLYDDGCIPTSSIAAWDAYVARLARLAAYKIVT